MAARLNVGDNDLMKQLNFISSENNILKLKVTALTNACDIQKRQYIHSQQQYSEEKEQYANTIIILQQQIQEQQHQLDEKDSAMQTYQKQLQNKDIEHKEELKALELQIKSYSNNFNKINDNNNLKMQEIDALKIVLSEKESEILHLKQKLTASYQSWEQVTTIKRGIFMSPSTLNIARSMTAKGSPSTFIGTDINDPFEMVSSPDITSPDIVDLNNLSPHSSSIYNQTYKANKHKSKRNKTEKRHNVTPIHRNDSQISMYYGDDYIYYSDSEESPAPPKLPRLQQSVSLPASNMKSGKLIPFLKNSLKIGIPRIVHQKRVNFMVNKNKIDEKDDLEQNVYCQIEEDQ